MKYSRNIKRISPRFDVYEFLRQHTSRGLVNQTWSWTHATNQPGKNFEKPHSKKSFETKDDNSYEKSKLAG
jgi:hypothetical protein